MPLDWVPQTPPGKVRVPFELYMAEPGSAELAAEIDVALRTWALPPCTAFRGKYIGARPVLPGAHGINAVILEDKVWPANLIPHAIAQTIVTTYDDGFVHDAFIHLNAVEYTFSTNGREGAIDLRGVLVHEIGHVLGLGHTEVPRATMTERNPPGLAWRSLEKDDRDGVCALYPGTGDPGCDTTPCPDGFACVARACERMYPFRGRVEGVRRAVRVGCA
jgi:hypothetical protein